MTRKLLCAIALTLASISFASAQVYSSPYQTDSVSIEDASSCVELTSDMRYGMKDSQVNGQVSDLQLFLQDKGYLSSDPTGYFGGLTRSAVMKFQVSKGITGNGLVGPLTRGKIKALSCGYVVNTQNTQPTSVATSTASSTVTSVTLYDPFLSASSPVSQAVIGGSQFGIATFALKASQYGAVIKEMKFSSNAQDAIDSVTVGGVTAPMVNGTAVVTNLSVPIQASQTDIPVTVRFGGFKYATQQPGVLSASVPSVMLTLTSVIASANGKVVQTSSKASSNPMTLVGSKPTITVGYQGSPLVVGAENKIGEFTITADSNGKLALSQVQLNVNAVGLNATFSNPRLGDKVSGIDTQVSASGSLLTFRFKSDYEIGAGQSRTFGVYATVNGTQQTASLAPSIVSSLVREGFLWRDTLGGNTQFTGSVIRDFPSNSFRTGEAVTTSAPSCTVATDKSSYTFGNTIRVTYTSANANYTAFVPDTSGKDNLVVSSDKMNTSGTATFTANVIGNPTITLKAVATDGRTATCSISFSVTAAPYAYPTISGISMSSATPGTSVTIYGKNFDSGTYVTWGGASGSTFIPTKYSSDTVTFTVPQVSEGTYEVSVGVKASDMVYGAPGVIKFRVLALAAKPTSNLSISTTNRGITTLAWTSENATKCFLSTEDSQIDSATTTPLSGSRDVAFRVPKRNVTLQCASADSSETQSSVTIYGYSFKNTADFVLKMAVKAVPTDLSYDINGDGRITSADALAYLTMNSIPDAIVNKDKADLALRMGVKEYPQDLRLDATGNGVVDSADAAAYMRLDASSTSGTTSSSGQVQGVVTICVDLPYNMHRGYEDANVTKLQKFLVSRGLLNEVTGFYGDKTVDAVKTYQTLAGLPTTGMVFDFTRQTVARETCQ